MEMGYLHPKSAVSALSISGMSTGKSRGGVLSSPVSSGSSSVSTPTTIAIPAQISGTGTAIPSPQATARPSPSELDVRVLCYLYSFRM